MDYTRAPLAFKLRKLLRYVRIHGVSRTLAKVRGHYHMRKRFEALPRMARRESTGKHVGLIGCGNFAFSNIAHYLVANRGRCIRGAMDVDIHHAASLFQRYGLDYYTDDAAEIFADPEIDLVYVASNHATHADYAIAAIEAGKAVHIEKPHVASHDQLRRLTAAIETNDGRVHLGFNRPHSEIGRTISRHLAEEDGPSMLNWFVAGHQLEAGHWYHDEGEGGRILGNVCHWTDLTYRMIPEEARYPVRITPTRAEQADCNVAVTFSFGDGSIATITFSAKGHTFQGVRERFSAHRGDVLVAMDDFRILNIDRGDERITRKPRHLDQGHEASILAGYELSMRGGSWSGDDPRYVRETAELFLATRQALEESREIVLEDSARERTRPWVRTA